jgi:hypothetical protein
MPDFSIKVMPSASTACRRPRILSTGATYFVRGLSEVQSSIDQAWNRIANHYSVHLDEPVSEGGDFRIRLETEPQQDLVYRETMAPTSPRE